MRYVIAVVVACLLCAGSCSALVYLVPATEPASKDDPGGNWAHDGRVARYVVDGEVVQEYESNDDHKRIRWSFRDSAGWHSIAYDPVTGEETGRTLDATRANEKIDSRE